jgi:23S rRNA (uracil1939-C5)-methyltransferase
LNPPRKGCDPVLLKELTRLEPSKIIYISCNPATLARDLAFLNPSYQIDAVQPFDMFPQTAHVETVVKLSLI